MTINAQVRAETPCKASCSLELAIPETIRNVGSKRQYVPCADLNS